MESKFAVESCVRGTTSTKSLGEELPCEWYAVAVMRKAHHRRLPSGRCQLLARYFWPISCLLAISCRSVACSIFLADQRQRYCSIMSAYNLVVCS